MFYKTFRRMNNLLVFFIVFVSNVICQDSGGGLNKEIKGFISYNYIHSSIGEQGDKGEIFLIGGEIQGFKIVNALNGQPGAVSFQSARKPDSFLYHTNGLAFLHRDDGSISFKNNASFIERKDKFFKGYSAFESWNYQGSFLRHQGFRVKLQQEDISTLYKWDASFRLANINSSDPTNSTYEIDLPLSPQGLILNGTYILNRGGISFKLINISGPIDTDFASTFPPDPCTSQEFDQNSPGKYFCMNENNGDIYSTLFIDNGRSIKHGSRYIFHIGNEQGGHTMVFEITLLFKDKCYPANDLYPDPDKTPLIFGTCVGPYFRPVIFPIDSSNTSLDVRASGVAVLGFQFPTSSFASDIELIEMNIWADGKRHAFIEPFTTESKQIINTPSINNLLNQNIFLNLIGQLRNGSRRFLRIARAELYTTRNWQPCSQLTCINLFKSWNESIQNFPSQSECTLDKYFLNRYYSVCTDLKPTFTSMPSIFDMNVGLCEYRSIIDLNSYSYLLLNGTKRINFTASAPVPARRRREVANVVRYTLGTYQVQDFDNEGYYQCVLFDPQRMSAPVVSNVSRLLTIPEPVFMEPRNNISYDAPVGVGGQRVIRGCVLRSPIDVSVTHAYILKNGIERISLSRAPQQVDGGIYDYPPLVLDPVKISDEGFYQCVVNYKGRELLSNRFINLVEELDITFLTGPVQRSGGVEGCSFQFPLNILLDPSVYWLLNNTIRINVTVQRGRDRGSYVFPRHRISRFDDIGFYQCVLYEPDYMRSPSFSNISALVTLSGPDFKPTLSNRSVTIGSPFAFLNCEFDSEIKFYTNETYWLKDGTEIQAVSSSPFLINGTSNSYRFAPKSLTKGFEDEGFYQCGIFAGGYMTQPVLSDRIYLTINEIRTTFLRNAPQITNTVPKNITCQFTTNVGKTVNYTGYWLHNRTNQIPATINRMGDLYEFENLSLETYLSSGTYQCVVFNADYMKTPARSNFSEVVKFSDPVFVLSRNALLNVILYSNFTLPSCIFRSEVTVASNDTMWLKNNKQYFVPNPQNIRLNTTYYKFPNNTIVFANNLTQEGFYQCQVYLPYMTRPAVSQRYRVIISELSINFTRQPQFARNPKNGLLVIKGCVAKVPFNTPKDLTMKGYWLQDKNGIQNKTDHPEVTISQNEKNEYIFPDLPVEYFNETTVFYHCAIYNDDVMRTHKFSEASHDSPFAPPSPTFTEGPVILNHNVTPGVPFKIAGCKLNSSLPFSQADVYWLFNGKRVNSSGISLVNYTNEGNMKMHDLSFTQALLKHQGRYMCAVFVDKWFRIPIVSKAVEFSISVAVTFTQDPAVNLTKNSLAITGCKYNANKDLSSDVYWLFNGVKVTRRTSPPIIIGPRGVKPQEEGRTPLQPREADRSPARPRDGERKRRNVEETLDYEFSLPGFPITSMNQIGTYRCVINSTSLGLYVVSKEVNVTEIPAPIITEDPTLTSTSNKVGGPVEISKCQFTSTIQLKQEHVYWLKDGLLKIPTQSTRVIDEILRDGEDDIRPDGTDGARPLVLDFNAFTTAKLNISQSNFTTQGYYRCVIDVPGFLPSPVKSKKVNVQFSDLSDTRVVVKIDSPFDDALLDSTSIEYRNLKQKIENELEQRLNSKDNEEVRRKRIVEVLSFSKGSIDVTSRIVYVNVTDSQRLDNCNSMKSLLSSKDEFADLTIKSVSVNNLDCCEKSVIGEESFKGEFLFNSTLVSRNATNQCHYNSDGSTTHRRCVSDLESGPQWLAVDLKECRPKTETTFNLIVLNETAICSQNVTKNCSPPTAVVAKLRQIVHNSSVITTKEDISMTESIISNTVNHLFVNVSSPRNITEKENKAVENILECVSIILDSPVTLVAKSQQYSGSSTGILNSLDTLAKKIGMTGVQNYSVSEKNIGLFVTNLEKTDFQVETLESNNSLLVSIEKKTQLTQPRDVLSRIFVPKDAFKNNKEIVYSYVFRNDEFFLNGRQIEILLREDGTTARRVVQSPVNSVTLGDSDVTNLQRPISLLFRKFAHVDLKGNNTCEFWNFSIGLYGHWSQRGCYRTPEKETENLVACECNHLTNFALLLDVSQTGDNPLELQIVTWIGCAISLAGLFLTILTYLIFPNLRKKLPPKILICLCISLMALLIIFLVGIEETSSRDGCKVIAALLQYFMLTSFCWMVVEGVNLYRCFVKVFKTGGNKKFIIRASIFAWGLPAVIVAVTASVKPDNLGNSDFCVVRGDSFYFGVLLPIGLVIVANFIILFLVMRGLSKGSMRKTNAEAQKLFSQARIAFMCSMLLGVTWAFALFAVGEATTVFQWLFCIFNSLQGFFIFVFYTLRNNEARTEWKKCLGFHINKNNSSNTYEMGKGKQIGLSHVLDSSTGYESDSSSRNVNLKAY